MNKQNGKNEHFDIKHTDAVKQKVRYDNAIQSCDILRLNHNVPERINDNDELSNYGEAYDTMKSVLDGSRIKKWKPGKNDIDDLNAREAKNGKEYCYMYDDLENNMKDYAMYGGCSKENDMFKNADFISKLFKTKQQDATHNIPLEKCVMEIDPEHTSSSNVQKFWNNWGSTMCSNTTDPLRSSMLTMRNNITDKTNQKNDLLPQIQENDTNLKKTQGEIRQCNKLTKDQEEKLNKYKFDFNQEFERYRSLETNKIKALKKEEEIEDKHDTLRKINQQYQNDFLTFDAKNNECQPKYKICDNQRINLQRERDIHQDNWNRYQEQEKMLKNNYGELSKEYNVLVPPVSQCLATLNKTTEDQDNMMENYTKKKNIYDTCIEERNLYDTKSSTMSNLLGDMQEKEKECLLNRNAEQENLNACQIVNEKCGYLQNKHQNIALRLNEIEDKYEDCNNKRETLKSNIRSLEEINVELYNTLEESQELSHKAEQMVYTSEVEETMKLNDIVLQDYTTHLEQIANEKIKTSGCSQKGELVMKIKMEENNNATLKYRIESLKAKQCSYCDPTVKQCAEKFKNEDVLCQYQNAK
jgi:hypothetical protein